MGIAVHYKGPQLLPYPIYTVYTYFAQFLKFYQCRGWRHHLYIIDFGLSKRHKFAVEKMDGRNLFPKIRNLDCQIKFNINEHLGLPKPCNSRTIIITWNHYVNKGPLWTSTVVAFGQDPMNIIRSWQQHRAYIWATCPGVCRSFESKSHNCVEHVASFWVLQWQLSSSWRLIPKNRTRRFGYSTSTTSCCRHKWSL